MRSNYKRLGDFIQQVKNRNIDNSLTVEYLRGINITKEFMPSVANVTGTDLSVYKVVEKNQFAYNPMHVGRDEILPIGMLGNEDSIIVSPAYVVFEIVDSNELVPEYLMMWCRRSEFDRNAWFTTDSSVRGGFNWEDFCDLQLPIPSIEKQREIVKEYHVIVDRIKLNEQLNQKLEDTAQSIYKEWFVNFEFPDENGKPYKSNGGEMVYFEELEIPKGWKLGSWSDIATQFSGYSFKGEEYSFDDGISVVRGENVTEQKLRWDTHKKWDRALPERAKKCFLKEYDIVIGMDGSKVGKNWAVINKHQLPLLLAQRVSCVRAKQDEWQTYLYYSMFINKFDEYVSQIHTGTSVPHISGEQIMDFQILIPNISILESFNHNVFSMLKLKLINNQMNHDLIELQKVLLSKMATIEG